MLRWNYYLTENAKIRNEQNVANTEIYLTFSRKQSPICTSFRLLAYIFIKNRLYCQ